MIRPLARASFHALRGAGRPPRASRWIALVAVLNATAWGILVPPFHVPDENAHIAYVQYFAETGRLPKGGAPLEVYSPEINATLTAVDFPSVVGNSLTRVPLRERQRQALQAARERAPSRVGSGDVATATNNPPLYYSLQALVYHASPSDDLLTRIGLMRVLSALLAGATAFFSTLFLRELFPTTPWAWAGGGLVVALQPLFGFIGSGVNNDGLLFCAAAALFFGLARLLRRGITPRRALAVGLALSAGALAKATMIAFVPAVALGFVLAIVAAPGHRRRSAARSVAFGVVAFVLPLVAYVVMSDLVWQRPVWGAASSLAAGGGAAVAPIGATGNLREALSYTWQLFLPSLGVFSPMHSAPDPFYDIWFRGFVGHFGWLDYAFPEWVYSAAKGVAWVVVALAITTLIRERRAVARRRWEIVIWMVAVAGLLGVIGLAGYDYWRTSGGKRFEQARYLLPLLPLYGALVGLAIRAGGRRAGPLLAAGAAIIAVSWSMYAQILTALRYYG